MTQRSDTANMEDYRFSLASAIEPDFTGRFRLTAKGSLLLCEVQTLYRLVRYFAANDNVPPAHLERELLKTFDVPALSQLESCRFPDAVEHLLDLSEGTG